jgi:hypothetical protein
MALHNAGRVEVVKSQDILPVTVPRYRYFTNRVNGVELSKFRPGVMSMESDMAIRLKLGNYETVRDDPLGRPCTGYFPRMTEQEAWEAGRGVWKVSIDKLARQRFAVIVGEGVVRAIAEVSGSAVHGDRLALEGSVLSSGHPVYDAWIGQPDPVETGSQNPVGYCELPQEKPFLERPGPVHTTDNPLSIVEGQQNVSGVDTDCQYRPPWNFRCRCSGHDVRAMQAQGPEHFGGSPLRLIRWVDDVLANSAIVSSAVCSTGPGSTSAPVTN